ncbi:MAG: hypothetical protein V1913_05985 [Fibrobacterota bacterium]
MKCIFLILIAATIYAQETPHKNFISYSGRGIEYGRFITDKLSASIAVDPSFSSTRDTASSSEMTYRYSSDDKTVDLSLDATIFLRSLLIKSTFFNLHGFVAPSAAYWRGTVTRNSSYDDPDSALRTTSTERWSRRYFAKLQIGLEPCFKPHDRVECFWYITTGIAFSRSVEGTQQSSPSNRVNYENRIYYLDPKAIDIFRNIGIRYYF